MHFYSLSCDADNKSIVDYTFIKVVVEHADINTGCKHGKRGVHKTVTNYSSHPAIMQIVYCLLVAFVVSAQGQGYGGGSAPANDAGGYGYGGANMDSGIGDFVALSVTFIKRHLLLLK